jgi:hypothetical protein
MTGKLAMHLCSILSMASLIGCGMHQVVMTAPADSYVCFSKFGQCPEDPIPQAWMAQVRPALMELTGQDHVVVPIVSWPSTSRSVHAAIESGRRSDIHYTCPSLLKFVAADAPPSQVESTLLTDQQRAIFTEPVTGTCVRYYSPIVVSQYIEDLRRLDYAIHSCQRVVDAITRQVAIFSIQDEASGPSISSDSLSARAAAEDMKRLDSLTEDERTEYVDSRNEVIGSQEQVRKLAKEQMLKHEFAEKFADIILLAEGAQATVDRDVFYLRKVANQDCSDGRDLRPLVPNGSWVTKGIETMRLTVKE